MKWTRTKAAKAAAEYSAAIDAVQAEIREAAKRPDWFEFAMSEEGKKLFVRRQRFTRLWVEAHKRELPRATLAKMLRYCYR